MPFDLQSVVKLMQGLLQAMMRQVRKYTRCFRVFVKLLQKEIQHIFLKGYSDQMSINIQLLGLNV